MLLFPVIVSSDHSPVSLRDVSLDDADFVFTLRNDKSLSKYINSPPSTVRDQRKWLEQYSHRRLLNQEFYFIIEHKGSPVGCVRIYEIQGDVFTWGSWIIARSTPMIVSIESVRLVYKFAFDTLSFYKAIFDVRKQNKSVLRFHKLYGARSTSVDDQNEYFAFTRDDYKANEKFFKAISERFASE